MARPYRAFDVQRADAPDSLKSSVTRSIKWPSVLSLALALILLDNMGVDEMARAVKLAAGRAKLEASGNVGFQNVREVAETGVDYISVGSLTHSVAALDIGLDIRQLDRPANE